jgi:hypothetical protein
VKINNLYTCCEQVEEGRTKNKQKLKIQYDLISEENPGRSIKTAVREPTHISVGQFHHNEKQRYLI